MNLKKLLHSKEHATYDLGEDLSLRLYQRTCIKFSENVSLLLEMSHALGVVCPSILVVPMSLGRHVVG